MAFRGFSGFSGRNDPGWFRSSWLRPNHRFLFPFPYKGTGISRASTIRTCDGNDGSDSKFDSNVRRHRAVGPLRPLERAGRTAALNFTCGASPRTPHSPWGRRKDGVSFLLFRVWRSALVKPFRGISSLASLAPVFHDGLTTLPRNALCA